MASKNVKSYVALAEKYYNDHETLELTAKDNAMTTCVIACEILQRNEICKITMIKMETIKTHGNILKPMVVIHLKRTENFMERV